MLFFTLSYFSALLLEVMRLLIRQSTIDSKQAQKMVWLWAGIGFVTQSQYLFNQIFLHNGHIFDSIQGWMLTVSWLVIILYFCFTFRYPTTPFGLFLLPITLLSIGAAVHFAEATPFPREVVGYWWRVIHGVGFLLATVTSFAGFMTGIMYFAQTQKLKRKQPSSGVWKLPSVEWLQKINSRSVLIFGSSLGLGILSGFAINRMNADTKSMISVADPMITMTVTLFLFLVIYLFLIKPHQEGRRIALLTILCFVFLVTILFTGLFAKNAHWRNLHGEPQPPQISGGAP